MVNVLIQLYYKTLYKISIYKDLIELSSFLKYLGSIYSGLWVLIQIIDYFSKCKLQSIPNSILYYLTIGLILTLKITWPKNSFSHKISTRDFHIKLVLGASTQFSSVPIFLIQGKNWEDAMDKNTDLNYFNLIKLNKTIQNYTLPPANKLGNLIVTKSGKSFYLINLNKIKIFNENVFNNLWEFINEKQQNNTDKDLIISIDSFAHLLGKDFEEIFKIISISLISFVHKSNSIYFKSMTLLFNPRELIKYKNNLSKLEEDLKYYCYKPEMMQHISKSSSELTKLPNDQKVEILRS